MNASWIDAAHRSPKLGKVLVGLVLASVLGAATLPPALAEENGHRDEAQNRDHQGSERQRERAQNERKRGGERGQSSAFRRHYDRDPVYEAPPVYYPPQQSPGISLFLPFDLRSR